ncbi:Leukocyte receptor cluster member 1 [Halotydeus destructor]|nr:Leukocyte receptor cluster member 1 [Halotydeus destructor]
MNILPKKSWHVRTYKNIEKVRKDEAKAAEEERQLEAKINLAEQEARTDFMRKRARQLGNADSQSSSSLVADGKEVTDIFADVKEGKGDRRKNDERAREKKDEQDKWEKQIGLLQFLSDGSADKPWYLESHDDRMKLSGKERKIADVAADEKEVKDARAKHSYDPLNKMQVYLDQMKKSESANQRLSVNNASSCDGSKLVGKKEKAEKLSKHSRRHKSKKHKKSSSKKDEIERSSSDLADSTLKASNEGLDKLRSQRVLREKRERERVKLLLQTKDRSVEQTAVVEDERKRSYNGLFNPHLVKRSR